jgi:hypothetical protein
LAITTTYRGIEYRSRLEARWAAFFKGLGWQTTYEPFDGEGYIPDFLIHGERPLLVEVKPAVTMPDYEAATGKADRGLGAFGYDVLIVGADPLPQFASTFGYGNPPAGLLGEAGYDNDRTWGVANWMICRACFATAVFHDHMSYAARPCGHYEGDHYINAINLNSIEENWAKACNDVKWRGRAA